MSELSPRESVVQQTLNLLGAESPWLREQVEQIVDRLPHIFHYDTALRPAMVRYHVLRSLGAPTDLL
ncbi:MAG: hypothetical protein AAFV53_00060 [Myxococcota bacterium]